MQIQPITDTELARFRNDTAGTRHKIHFNNAGCALPPDIVLEKTIAYLQEEALMGGYETEAKYHARIDNTYNLIASLINADADEIAIVENAGMGWSLAFHGISFQPGDEILTSEMEYITNYLGFLNVQERYGVQLKIIPNDAEGNFCLTQLEKSITPKTRLIAITHLASSTGALMPVEAIGRIARKHGLLYLIDACQTVGHAPVDVKKIGCDFLSATGRKYLRAPRGTGFLFVRKEIRNQLSLFMMDSHAAELTSPTTYTLRNDGKRFELFEKNRALSIGMSAAIEYALSVGIDRIWHRIQYLASDLRAQLGQIPHIIVHDKGDQLSGIVTFSVKDTENQIVKTTLAAQNINVSVSLPYFTPTYMHKLGLKDIIRASVHYYNSEEEIKILCNALAAIKNTP